ncbi:MAG: SAM-dependent methyltransferase [Chthonomonadales bacterium]|nr:SAM-dependent methyltransferase [Chthonomonadales bacterium]
MLDADHLRALMSPAGEALVAAASMAEGDVVRRLSALRRVAPPGLAAAALELADLRLRATRRFPAAGRMYLTRAGLEQASSAAVAAWRAARFPAGVATLDLCCGIGGDTMALAGRGPVIGFDLDMAHVLCAKANASAAGHSRVEVARADVTGLRLRGEAAFLDPSRRPDGRRERRADRYAPPLEWVRDVAPRVGSLAVKVSPALDDAVLAGFGARLEFVSEAGECKEAVLWIGDAGPAHARCASVLPAGVTLAADPDARPPSIGAPKAWLYDPDPAVVRAHAIADLAARIDASLLDSRIAYLTGDNECGTPFAEAFRVLEWLPFGLRALRSRLAALDLRAVSVKRRGVPMEPADVLRALPREGDRPAVIVLTRVAGRPAALICDGPVALAPAAADMGFLP